MRSTSGFVAFWHCDAIAWHSKRRKFVSSSTMEAEYISGFHAAQAINQLRNFISDISNDYAMPPTPLGMDNSAAQKTTTADCPIPRSRHINVKYHYFSEQASRKRIMPYHLPSANNPADCLTEALKPKLYTSQVQLLKISDIPSLIAATVA